MHREGRKYTEKRGGDNFVGKSQIAGSSPVAIHGAPSLESGYRTTSNVPNHACAAAGSASPGPDHGRASSSEYEHPVEFMFPGT